jgi:hypothetical protein
LKMQKRIIWIAIPLIAVFWFSAANSSSVPVIGKTVEDSGSTNLAGLPAGLGGEITYYIPIKDSSTAGIYGDHPIGFSCADSSTNGIGTCSDSGGGYGYEGADALMMNIYFGLSSQSASAQLDFNFVDLDLEEVADPTNFLESMSLSYWDSDSDMFNLVTTSVKATSGLDLGPGSSFSYSGKNDPITWSLDLAALGYLSDLNESQANSGGFWIQLGFGSTYTSTGSNTPEYLTAELTVAPVPVPAAIWLFGTALIGFVGMSRRTVVT